MSRILNRRRFVPLLLADDFQSVPPNPPGDGDGDSDIPVSGSDCDVDITGGGGDTFDCYDDQDKVISLPLRGTGWGDEWIFGDSEWFTRGDGFEDYSDGPTGTLESGEGFDGAWVYGDGS